MSEITAETPVGTRVRVEAEDVTDLTLDPNLSLIMVMFGGLREGDTGTIGEFPEEHAELRGKVVNFVKDGEEGQPIGFPLRPEVLRAL